MSITITFINFSLKYLHWSIRWWWRPRCAGHLSAELPVGLTQQFLCLRWLVGHVIGDRGFRGDINILKIITMMTKSLWWQNNSNLGVAVLLIIVFWFVWVCVNLSSPSLSDQLRCISYYYQQVRCYDNHHRHHHNNHPFQNELRTYWRFIGPAPGQ